MYALSLVMWEVPVLLMILLAYQAHLLTKKQAESHIPYRGESVAVLADHRGVIGGDIFVVSPLCAWMTTYYASSWSLHAQAIAMLISAVCSVYMMYTWAKRSKKHKLIETFNFRGKPTLNGWVHGLYMARALMVMMLFFFATSHVSETFVWFAVGGLCLHIAVGLIQPERHTHGGVEMQTFLTVAIVWLLLIGRGLVLVNR